MWNQFDVVVGTLKLVFVAVRPWCCRPSGEERQECREDRRKPYPWECWEPEALNALFDVFFTVIRVRDGHGNTFDLAHFITFCHSDERQQRQQSHDLSLHFLSFFEPRVHKNHCHGAEGLALIYIKSRSVTFVSFRR